MVDGGWRIKDRDGEWRMVNGGWRIEMVDGG